MKTKIDYKKKLILRVNLRDSYYYHIELRRSISTLNGNRYNY